ncbi:hypothetical protein [Lentzea terrae]|uniref:hypothetical protein n=1 Tax=Lentzea terrae TaxID=2200761 RepID=UPI001300B84C|nr:hypothetical protein [Lentzea terrae]
MLLSAGLAVALGVSLLTGTIAQAAPGMCDRDPRNPVAQMCATTSAHMYGSFTAFIFPVVSHSTSSAGNAYNATRVFTDDVDMSTSYETGLEVGWGSPTGATTYRAYWVDYTGGYNYHPIGDFVNTPDSRQHNFMSLPHCDGCRSRDIFYDFNFAGTTKDGVNVASHHVVTGWELSSDSYNDIAFARTTNRVQWLNGNLTWERFSPAEVKTRAPNGDCSIGSDPAYCWRFDTSVTQDGAGSVAAWEVTKSPVQTARTGSVQPVPQHTRGTVDQNRLQECIANDASQCMDTVPGLRDCVRQRLVCNESAAIESATRMRTAALTAQDARTAAVDFLVARKALAGTAETVSVQETEATLTVTIKGAVSEFTGDHRSFQRADLEFDRASHQLLSVRMS